MDRQSSSLGFMIEAQQLKVEKLTWMDFFFPAMIEAVYKNEGTAEEKYILQAVYLDLWYRGTFAEEYE